MSPARNVRERGTWKAAATLAIAVALSVGNIAGCVGGALDAPLSAPATAAEREPAPMKQPLGSEPKKKQRKRKRPTVEQMIHSEFGARGDDAVRIARCESKLDPQARSHAGAAGVFQLMPVHSWRVAKVKGKHLYDARTNVKVARHLHQDEGWSPWVCARILGLTG